VPEMVSGLIYTNVKIENKEFENCTFEKCRFIECIFENCRFIDSSFIECSISANKPYNSQFINISFKDSKIMGLDWTKAKSIYFLSFERCDISYSNFSFLKLPNLQLRECIAKTDFSNTIFSHTNLTKTDFRKAFNYGIDINFNKLTKAKFSLPEATSLLKSLDIILED